MAKDTDNITQHVIIFVEGDTDEIFFKSLLEYYRSVSLTALKHCDVYNLKGVTRYTSKLLAKLRNDILPEARNKNITIQTVCCSYDTDVFEVQNPLMVNWDFIRKSIKRLGIPDFVRLGVKSSIEDWILDDLEGVCKYIKLKQVPKSFKGHTGSAKLCDLYSKAKKNYNKGYTTRPMIESLDFSKIRAKRYSALKPLEEVLGITLQSPLASDPSEER